MDQDGAVAMPASDREVDAELTHRAVGGHHGGDHVLYAVEPRMRSLARGGGVAMRWRAMHRRGRSTR